MKIEVDKEKNRVYINKKEYALITDYNDQELGHVLKCCTLRYKDYAVFYLLENNGKYEKIEDEELFSKIVQKYEKPLSYIIEN